MKTHLVWMTLWALAAGRCQDGVAGQEELEIVIEVDNQAGFDDTVVKRAEEIAAGVFSGFGVRLEWRTAPTARAGLRIVLAPVSALAFRRNGDAVGLAALPGDGRMGYLSWILRPKIEEVIDNTWQKLPFCGARDTRRAVLLGYVVSHELGHHLLGTAAHSDTGIMSPGWYLNKLHLACTGRLGFQPSETRRIRTALRARNELAKHRMRGSGEPASRR